MLNLALQIDPGQIEVRSLVVTCYYKLLPEKEGVGGSSLSVVFVFVEFFEVFHSEVFVRWDVVCRHVVLLYFLTSS